MPRITNNTDETVVIEPGDTLYYEGKTERVRVLVGKMKRARIDEVLDGPK